jgi:hypothetical protein
MRPIGWLGGEGKKQLLEKAREAERTHNQAIQRGPYIDFAGLPFQVSIILISMVLITERRTLSFSGVVAAIVGTLLSMDGFFMFFPIPWIG